jgi:capsular polysaccharide biosynthesis protein
LVVFFLEWLEQDVIRSASDVERTIGVTVLGSIPPGTASERKHNSAKASWLANIKT